MTTRDRILDAAAQVIRDRGLAHATTREIARVADLSEAALYKHFADKETLFVDVLHERLPQFIAALGELPARVGRSTVRDNLVVVVRAAVQFYAASFPMAASLFAERELLARHRAAVARDDRGPHRANEALAAYVRAEQSAGRIDAKADADAMASLLLGACFQRAFLHAFAETPSDDAASDAFATSLVRTLMRGARVRKKR